MLAIAANESFDLSVARLLAWRFCFSLLFTIYDPAVLPYSYPLERLSDASLIPISAGATTVYAVDKTSIPKNEADTKLPLLFYCDLARATFSFSFSCLIFLKSFDEPMRVPMAMSHHLKELE